MKKSSEIIKNECCGVGLLNVDKAELVNSVKAMELEIKILREALLDNDLHKQSSFEALKVLNNG